MYVAPADSPLLILLQTSKILQQRSHPTPPSSVTHHQACVLYCCYNSSNVCGRAAQAYTELCLSAKFTLRHWKQPSSVLTAQQVGADLLQCDLALQREVGSVVYVFGQFMCHKMTLSTERDTSHDSSSDQAFSPEPESCRLGLIHWQRGFGVDIFRRVGGLAPLQHFSTHLHASSASLLLQDGAGPSAAAAPLAGASKQLC